MSLERERTPEPVAWFGNRNFIVPPDVVPVRRVSPLRKQKRTPWRRRPEGELICRSGGREWFADRLFVDPDAGELRTVCGASMTVHASCLVGLLVLVAGPPAPGAPSVHVNAPQRMPAFVAMIDATGGGGGDPASAPRLAPTPTQPPAATSPTPRPRVIEASQRRVAAPPQPVVQTLPATAPPVATESSAAPIASDGGETMARFDPPARTTDARDGSDRESAPTGSGSGTGAGAGGTEGGGGAGGAGGRTGGTAMSPGPYRLGKGIDPPRKIKDVRPIYPSDAMALRALGTVAIEAIVGVDGLVHDAKVIHSIPRLDQAALEAVRQWQFTPARLNGMAVAVIVTVLVQFSIY